MEAYSSEVRPSSSKFVGPSENRLESDGDARPATWLLATSGGTLLAPAEQWRLSGYSVAVKSRRSASITFTAPSHTLGTRDSR